jgi:hypothetical protein
MAHSEDVTAQLDALLASEEHVVGYSGDEVDDEGGIRVYVDAPGAGVPDEIAGRRVVEVLDVGPLQLKAGPAVVVNPQTKVRPLIGGLGIAGEEQGTLGYFVKVDDKLALLSAAHVLTKKTASVIQPDDAPAEVVAKLTLSIFKPEDGIDAATAKLGSGIDATLTVNDNIGRITGSTKAQVGDSVRKSGQMTPNLTSGTVSALNDTITLDGHVYKSMIRVDAAAPPFSQGGDSGSLVVKGTAAIGVLAGGGHTQDWVCHIDKVLTALGATLAT